jgi:bacterioferritin-associated ferredoxin
MYICICRAVSDQAIRDEVANGATNIEELTKRLNVGNACAKCIDDLKELIHQTLIDHK